MFHEIWWPLFPNTPCYFSCFDLVTCTLVSCVRVMLPLIIYSICLNLNCPWYNSYVEQFCFNWQLRNWVMIFFALFTDLLLKFCAALITEGFVMRLLISLFHTRELLSKLLDKFRLWQNFLRVTFYSLIQLTENRS